MMHCPKCGKEADDDAVFCSACGAKLAPSQPGAATPPGIFKFACPHCSQRIAVKIEWSGRYAKCPGCGNTIQIPPAPDMPDAPDPAVAPPPQPVRRERKALIPPPPVRNEPPPPVSSESSLRNAPETQMNSLPEVKLAPRPIVPTSKVTDAENAAASAASGGKTAAENNPSAPETIRRPVLSKVPPPSTPPSPPPSPRPVVISAPYEPGKIRPVLRPVNCSERTGGESDTPESFRPVKK